MRKLSKLSADEKAQLAALAARYEATSDARELDEEAWASAFYRPVKHWVSDPDQYDCTRCGDTGYPD